MGPLANPCNPRLHVRLCLEKFNRIEFAFELFLGVEPVNLTVTWTADVGLLVPLFCRHVPLDSFIVSSLRRQMMAGQSHLFPVAQ